MMQRSPQLSVGDIDVWAVMDGRFTLAEPPGFVAHEHDQLTGDGRWLMDIGGFVVRTKDRLIVIDAGSGPGDGEPVSAPPFSSLDEAPPELAAYVRALGLTDSVMIDGLVQSMAVTDIRTGSFGDNLARLGFAPKDVTDVLLSHLHFDHIGWVSKDGKPYFPNAVVRCERRDADFFLSPENDDSFYRAMWGAMPTSERMAPVMSRFEPWDEDTTIAPGIDCRFAPGHTPGSSIFVLTSGREQALILGDSVHCPHELVDPQFVLGGDMHLEQAESTREMIRKEACESAVHVGAPHFPGLRFGRVLPAERRISWLLA